MSTMDRSTGAEQCGRILGVLFFMSTMDCSRALSNADTCRRVTACKDVRMTHNVTLAGSGRLLVTATDSVHYLYGVSSGQQDPIATFSHP
jgi:hypothetical protein